MIFLSYFILEEVQTQRILLNLIPIFIGVILIVYEAFTFNFIGFSSAFAANLASASRSVFFKIKMKETKLYSPFNTFLHINFASFCLYIPIYIFQAFYNQNPSLFLSLFNQPEFILSKAFEFLVLGSLFNFFSNIFSFKVLSNIDSVSHSVINLIKRVFIVISSKLVFSTPITSVQWFGMILANMGVLSYSIEKIRSPNTTQVSQISFHKKEASKKLLLILVGLIIFMSCFVSNNKTSLNVAEKIEISNQIRFVDLIETNTGDNMRIKCIEKIKDEIKSKLKALIPKNQRTHLIDYPIHINYGDSFIW